MTFKMKRQHHATIYIQLITWINGILLPIIAILMIREESIESETKTWLVIGGFVMVAGFILLSTLSWYRFTYGVIEGEFRMEYGIFIKKVYSIPMERIQSVDHEQGILQRVFGVVRVRIKTASNLEALPLLHAVSKSESLELQDILTNGKHRSLFGNQKDEKKPYQSMTYKKMLLLSITSGTLFIIIPVLGSFLSFLENFVDSRSIFRFLVDHFQFNDVGSLVISVVILLILTILVSFLSNIMKYINFSVTKSEEHVVINRGVINRRQSLIPIKRIQALQIIENPIRKLFGFSTLRIIYLGNGEEFNKSLILHPLLHVRELQDFLHDTLPEFKIDNMDFQRVPQRSWHYMITFDFIVNILVASLVSIFFFPWGVLSFLLVFVLLIYAYKWYQDEGWYVHGELLVARTRFITRRTVIIPRNRIQSSLVRQSMIQRIGKLMNVEIQVAGGLMGKIFSIKYLDEKVARSLLSWSSYRAYRK
ncbi:PH domain-containing protein [Oceanobacillus zhaokaii]|nr:PH domain-containing protein [Oceanobacillus zhaokaii]